MAAGPREWTDSLLDDLRRQGDPPADEVVARYFAERSTKQPRDLVRHIIVEEHRDEEHRSPAVNDYLGHEPPLPEWTDPERLRRGEEFFLEWGLVIGALHYYASLPSAYAIARGVKVLHLTARLASDTGRRIHETAQMIIDVMTPGGLAVGAPGYRDARQVRLMHAAVRHLILHDPSVVKTCDPDAVGPHWCDEWGVPLNQEDMLATMLTFTEVIFGGLRLAGVRFSDEEADAYLHAWNVVGYLLGIRSDLLPVTLEEAPVLWATIRRRQHAPSPEGREMTAALLHLLEAHLPRRLQGLPRANMRYFLGDDVADMLAVGRANSMTVLFGPLRRVMSVIALGEQHNRILRLLSQRLGRAVFNSFLEAGRAGDRESFAIPTHLARRWQVPAATA